MRSKHGQRPTMRLALVVVRLDDGPRLQRAARDRQTRLEAAQFVGMILRREPAGEERHLPAGRLKSGQELAGDRTDSERIGGDRREPRRVGRVGDDADDGNVLPRGLRMYGLNAAGLPGAMIKPLVPSGRASSKSGMSPSPRLG